MNKRQAQLPKPVLPTPEECIALSQKLNPKKEPLTVEKLRSFPGCQQYTDQEATEIVDTVHQLVAIIFSGVYEGTFIEKPDLKENSIPINLNHINNQAA